MLNLLGTQAGHKIMSWCRLMNIHCHIRFTVANHSVKVAVLVITSRVAWKVASSILTLYCRFCSIIGLLM